MRRSIRSSPRKGTSLAIPVLALVGREQREISLPKLHVSPRVIAAASIFTVLVLLALELLSVGNHYAMRVTADTPTFMALVRDLAIHPLHPDSVFFGTTDTQSIHASVYLQVLAVIWKVVAPHGQLTSALSLGTFLGIVTIPVSLFVLAMLWLYTRQLAGTTAAFIALPALLLLFGPAHIAFPSDLTLNGMMDTGYFPTTFATGTTLATLVLLRRRSWPASLATLLLAVITITTDPLNGAILTVLMIAHTCVAGSSERNETVRIPLIIVWAFLLAGLWPAFDIFAAFRDSKLPVPFLIAIACVLPQLWLWSRSRVSVVRSVAAYGRRLLSMPITARTELRVSLFGGWAFAMLAMWAIYAMRHWPTNQPVLQAYRLGFYWNDQRDRWVLLLLPGICGVIGMLRLARRGTPEPLIWFSGFFVVGLVGALYHLGLGGQLPLYYRFILLCQVPLAVGAAAFLAHHKNPRAAGVLAAILIGAFAFKVITLIAAPTDLTYFRSSLPSVWTMGRAIPPHSGLVASNAGTSYYIPIATGNNVLTVGLGHADSGAEADRAKAGYLLMRRLYVGAPPQAARAVRQLWGEGVRWVVVEKFTTFLPPDLFTAYAAPYNSLISRRDIPYIARYNTRLAAVGHQTYDDGEFTIFKLDRAKLASATAGVSTIAAVHRRRVAAILDKLPTASAATARRLAPTLYHLGVRTVTLSLGALGAAPTLSAFGQSIATSDSVSVPASANGRWHCTRLCQGSRGLSAVEGLGRVAHKDIYFNVVVRLRGRSHG